MSLSPDQIEHYKSYKEATTEMLDILENEHYYKVMFKHLTIDEMLYNASKKVYPDFLLVKIEADILDIFRHSCIDFAKRMYSDKLEANKK